MSEPRCRGAVITFDAAKGYGRIKDEHDREFFAHFRDIKGAQSLQEGQWVEFQPLLHRKGNLAREIQIL